MTPALHRLIRILTVIIGILALVFAGIELISTLVIGMLFPTVQGEVIAIATIADVGQKPRQVITLRLADGNTITFSPRPSGVPSGEASPTLPRIGSTIPVVFNPFDPRTFTPLWNEPDPRKPSVVRIIFFALIGIILVGMSYRWRRGHDSTSLVG